MLNGLRIVEFEGLGPAPFAGMMLAEMGADVVLVQRKNEENVPLKPDMRLLHRGKRSLLIDLKSSDDIAFVHRLVATSDGLIEGFRPGVMERLGLGPAELQAIQPRLVYGRMTGWGQEGPRARLAGHDMNYIALSGALWYASPPGSSPFTPPTMVGDVGGGALYLVAGMLAGLLQAQRTGKGTVVDAAIVDGSAHMMSLLMALRPSGQLKTERGQSLLDGAHWSHAYACADGGWLAVQCFEPKFYRLFLQKLDLAEDLDFARQYDSALWPELKRRLAELIVRKPLTHWASLFANDDACVTPVLAPEQSAQDPHMQARDVWTVAHGMLQARAAPRFDGKPAADPRPYPEPGQDEAAIRADVARAEAMKKS